MCAGFNVNLTIVTSESGYSHKLFMSINGSEVQHFCKTIQ